LPAPPPAAQAGDSTPQAVPVVPTPAAEAVPAQPPEKPPRPAPGVGAPHGDPAVIDRALAARSPAELALLGQLARSGVPVPPQVQELFERRRQGASPEEQRRFVRTHFPKDMRLRMLTIRWINRLDPIHAQAGPQAFQPSDRPLPSLGSIERDPPPSRR
jgi:hypothetical protein